MTQSHLASDATADTAMRVLGTRLAALRKKAGYTQAQLARHIGYARTTVSVAEAGQGRQAAPFWAGCDTALATGGQLTAEYQRINARRTDIRVTRAATVAAERAAARHAATATRTTIAAVLARATTGQPAPAIAAIIIVWADGTTTTTAHPGPSAPNNPSPAHLPPGTITSNV